MWTMLAMPRGSCPVPFVLPSVLRRRQFVRTSVVPCSRLSEGFFLLCEGAQRGRRGSVCEMPRARGHRSPASGRLERTRPLGLGFGSQRSRDSPSQGSVSGSWGPRPRGCPSPRLRGR